MPHRLHVAPVASSSQLKRALSPGQADGYGTLDGETLVVEDATTAERLVKRYPNVGWADDSGGDDAPDEASVTRGTAEADSASYECGVNGCSRSVDRPTAACWQHEED
jgi:hypothetical protein